jgi:hypothetical protein
VTTLSPRSVSWAHTFNCSGCGLLSLAPGGHFITKGDLISMIAPGTDCQEGMIPHPSLCIIIAPVQSISPPCGTYIVSRRLIMTIFPKTYARCLSCYNALFLSANLFKPPAFFVDGCPPLHFIPCPSHHAQESLLSEPGLRAWHAPSPCGITASKM